jgi:hypothetical protein
VTGELVNQRIAGNHRRFEGQLLGRLIENDVELPASRRDGLLLRRTNFGGAVLELGPLQQALGRGRRRWLWQLPIGEPGQRDGQPDQRHRPEKMPGFFSSLPCIRDVSESDRPRQSLLQVVDHRAE